MVSKSSNTSFKLPINASESAFGQAMFFKYDTHQSRAQCHTVKDQGTVFWCNLSLTVVISAGPAPLSSTWQTSPKLPRNFLRLVFLQILGNCQTQFPTGFWVGAHGKVYGGYLGHHVLVKPLHSYTISPAHHKCHFLFQVS